MTLYTTNKEIEGVLIEALETLGHRDFAGRYDIQWKSRYTSKLGQAQYYPATDTGQIRLSTPLWQRATPDERRQCIIHELCHLTAFREAIRAKRKIKPHGPEWAAHMRKVGLKPERCHRVSNAGLKKKMKYYQIGCGCEKPVCVTQHKLTKMKKGRTYVCTACRTRLNPWTARLWTPET